MPRTTPRSGAAPGRRRVRERGAARSRGHDGWLGNASPFSSYAIPGFMAGSSNAGGISVSFRIRKDARIEALDAIHAGVAAWNAGYPAALAEYEASFEPELPRGNIRSR